MRLLTMNALRCRRKDVKEGSLRLVATKVEVVESAFDREFLLHVLPSVDWAGLRESAAAVGVTSLPEVVDEALTGDDAFLRALHHVLFDVHVIEGKLVCRESDHVFSVDDGRPNMMLPEDLV
mmetsp:Transcript_5652/g.18458  ORF Transcript_5652/g.18458 Transcript_5652/m.18458 type:complete len:122 (+) Transcript_5652:74-439(+)